MNADLIARIRQCPNLPSLPSVAIQVLDLAASADADIAEIARVISKDPALSSKILRTVNSSFYGRSQHVSTISHSLVILGLQSVKTLVLGFSLVTSLSQKKSKGFNHLQYWRRSIYSATAARIIAGKTGLVQQEEAFLAALLQDLGMLVLDLVLGSQYSEICEKSPTHSDLLKNETEALQMTHAVVGAILAEQWKLPPIFTTTIAGSHAAKDVADPVLRRIAQVVQLSGWCADVFAESHAASAIAQVRSFLSQYKLGEADCDQMLEQVAATTKEVASLFEINIGPAADFEAILKKANETLVELTLQSQMQATQLKEQNTVLKKQAATDGLTGLNNRLSFDQFLAENLVTAKREGLPITLLIMDLDKFKSVNDRFGHPAGDAVLTRVAKILMSAARPQDLAARYGGEEFALILPATPRAVAAGVAETIRRAVAAQPIKLGAGQTIPMTVSIGVATAESNGPLNVSAHLIKAADLAVYAAKNGGRNCVKVFTAKTAA